MMESKAVQELYERYGYAVHRRCLRLLGSRAEADDALQAVFVRVMRWGGLQQSEAPLPWLYRIADRVCFDQLKLRRRQASPEESARRLEQRAEQPSGERPEQLSEVREVLGLCEADVQEVAVLYYVDEMTQDEVADAVGCSRKSVRSRLAEFLRTARQVWGTQPAREGES